MKLNCAKDVAENMARATIASLARHSHEKDPFVARNFSGIEKDEEGKLWRGVLWTRSRGGSSELVALRGRYCARLLARSRTIFHRTLFPWDTLNSFPSRLTTFDTFAKMIHQSFPGARKMTHQILYWIKSIVEVIQWYNDTIFKQRYNIQLWQIIFHSFLWKEYYAFNICF